MRRRGEFSISTNLSASVDAVWAGSTSFEGINDEFHPLLKMTAPAHVRSRGLEGVTTGERICRSWILLFKLIPVDYDDLVLESLGPGTEFHERSTMLTQRVWEHDRIVKATGENTCRISDRIAWEPRLPIPGSLLRPLFGAVFKYRHHRLRRRWNGA